MVSVARIHWLAQHNGRAATVSFSYNQGKEKVKFVLDKNFGGTSTSIFWPCVIGAFSAVQDAMFLFLF